MKQPQDESSKCDVNVLSLLLRQKFQIPLFHKKLLTWPPRPESINCRSSSGWDTSGVKHSSGVPLQEKRKQSHHDNAQEQQGSRPCRRSSPPRTRDEASRPFAWEANYTTSLHVGEEVFDRKVFLCRRGQDILVCEAESQKRWWKIRRAGKRRARERPCWVSLHPISPVPFKRLPRSHAGYRHPELTRPSPFRTAHGGSKGFLLPITPCTLLKVSSFPSHPVRYQGKVQRR